jgi:transposase
MMPQPLRVLLCAQAVDMRRSFDGLAELVVSKLDEDPTAEGALFVFINTRRDRAKLLWRDTTGFCILYKRLEGRLFPVPEAPAGARRLELDVDALAALLEGAAELPPRAPTAREVARAARSLARAQMRR